MHKKYAVSIVVVCYRCGFNCLGASLVRRSCTHAAHTRSHKRVRGPDDDVEFPLPDRPAKRRDLTQAPQRARARADRGNVL